MGKEYDTRSFKSGNSVAIRIPAALGVEPDRDWTVAEDENGDLVIRLKQKRRKKFNIEKVWGIGRHLDLKPIEPRDRVFEERKLLWDDPEWLAARADVESGDKG
jgi:antitoxin VapB